MANNEAMEKLKATGLTIQEIRSLIGGINGAKTSARKAASSRENGKKGGRPRKKPAND